MDVVVLNKAKMVDIYADEDPPYVRADAGANFGSLARLTASRGFSGLEWAVGIPGTVGGAVFGNAGAHGSDMTSSLIVAEILHRKKGREKWPVDRMEYEYRSSCLKRQPGEVVILDAELKLCKSTSETIQEKIDQFSEYRHQTQPPGASMGSMFKNPPGDYAGRLIEAAGLKGMTIGGTQISPIHANFFINQGTATASDVYRLIKLTQSTVREKFGVNLELEIELCGEW
jgi:UDP-N-acetylmuramate dehydrogenase